MLKKYLCVDIGGTYVKFGVLDEDGKILYKDKFVTPQGDIDDLYSEILERFNNLKVEYKVFNGLALSCPGAVDSETGIINGVAAVPYIIGPNIKSELGELLKIPVEMENDANCAALAEVWLGEGVGNNDLCFIVLGTGLGGAIIKDKKIHKGKHLHAGEFGIMYFEKENGEPGIWGGTVSTGKLVEKVSDRLERTIDGIELFELAENGNEICKEEIEKWYKNLAIGIYNLQYIFDPEKVIIGGAISVRKDLADNITKELIKLQEKIAEAKILPNVKICKFKNDSNLIGALYNFLQRQ